jgi:hypothetical protein
VGGTAKIYATAKGRMLSAARRRGLRRFMSINRMSGTAAASADKPLAKMRVHYAMLLAGIHMARIDQAARRTLLIDPEPQCLALTVASRSSLFSKVGKVVGVIEVKVNLRYVID